MQSLQSPKRCKTSCREGMLHAATGLAATCLATPLQHKLRRKLHRVTLFVQHSSTFCNDCRDLLDYCKLEFEITCFWNHCKLQPDIATCDMSPTTCNESPIFKVAGQVARKIASCNTSSISGSWAYFLCQLFISENDNKNNKSCLITVFGKNKFGNLLVRWTS